MVCLHWRHVNVSGGSQRLGNTRPALARDIAARCSSENGWPRRLAWRPRTIQVCEQYSAVCPEPYEEFTIQGRTRKTAPHVWQSRSTRFTWERAEHARLQYFRVPRLRGSVRNGRWHVKQRFIGGASAARWRHVPLQYRGLCRVVYDGGRVNCAPHCSHVNDERSLSSMLYYPIVNIHSAIYLAWGQCDG
jgi:hypothetical protein